MKSVAVASSAVLSSCLMACSTGPVSEFDKYEISTEREKIGRIYHYVRTNQDGSDPEQVSVYRKDRTHLEVYKARHKCVRSALVTAELDLDRRSAARLTGGMLLPEAKHQEFAFMTYEPEKHQVDVRVKLPDQELTFKAPVKSEPWHVYDFDFASLTVMTPYLTKPESDFSFEMIMFSTDPALESPLIVMGQTDIEFVKSDTLNDRAVYQYRVGGEAFTKDGEDKGGYLWLDAEEGHIVLVELGIPNHREYQDFKLELTGIDDGGADVWRSLKLAHFEGCDQ